MPELFKESGVYKVRYLGVDGKKHTSTTGEADITRARQVVTASRLDEIELAARANALTADSLGKIMAGRKVTNETAIKGWKQWRALSTEPNTVRNNELVILQLFTAANALKAPVTKLDFAAIDRFVNTTEDVKVSTREQRLGGVKSYFEYCSAQGLCIGNPARLVRVRLNRMTHEQKEPTKRIPFTKAEYEAVFRKAEGFWKFATVLGYWTGMRLTDIACLEWATFTDKEIIVWTRKSESRIALPLKDPLIGGGDLVPVLLEIMMEHQHHPTYCFPEQRETVLDTVKRAKLSVQFGRLAESAGIEGKSFHHLRHAFATRLDKDGRSIEEIGRLLGHAAGAKETTKGYVHK